MVQQGGTVPVSQTKKHEIPLTLSSNSGNLVNTGYTFAGWNTKIDGSGTTYAEGTSYIANESITLYAKWTALPIYTISYNSNSATGGTLPEPQIKTQGTPLTLSSNSGNLVNTGYTFAGWNTKIDGSGTTYAEGANYTTDSTITLYAKWTALPTYTISYNSNGATGGTIPVSQTKVQGTPLTLASNSGNLVKTGYTFVGWNTKADGSGTAYKPDVNYTLTNNTTLYAQWSINTYTITYDANGANDGNIPDPQSGLYGTVITLAEQGRLLNSILDFAGWCTTADGTGDTYEANSSFILSSDITLYAKWTYLAGKLLIAITPKGENKDSYANSAEIVVLENGTKTTVNKTDDSSWSNYYNDNNDDYKGVFIANRSVTLSSFIIGKYEVSQDFYNTVMNENPSEFQGGPFPVENVTWYKAIRFCNELTKQTMSDIDCVYYADENFENIYIDGESVFMNPDKIGYRLPTEAEWEFAARGGDPTAEEWGYAYAGIQTANTTPSRFSSIESDENLETSVHYKKNSSEKIHDVNEFEGGNKLNICNMSGNVYEWCYDQFGSITTDTVTDPYETINGTQERIIRGGSWNSNPSSCAVSYRNKALPDTHSNEIGFRICRTCTLISEGDTQ